MERSARDYRKRGSEGKRVASGKRNTDSKSNRRIRKFRLPWRRKVRRDVKDRLFRFLFERDKEALLQLYNALNGTDYSDASALQIVTIESAVYVVMKNDLAFVLAGTLNLYEHQSTYNPNMPVRFLIYLAEEYQKLIDRVGVSLYGSVMIKLPTPRCVVFYNGEKDLPEESTIKLSDAFADKERPGDVELQVRMLNINYGHNKELIDKCRTLAEYAEFVAVSRQYVRKGMNLQEALNEAIDYCIEHEILYDTLREHRSEVLGMLLEEFDADKYERTIRMEGIEEGIRQGKQQGLERANRLTRLLIEQNRMEDLKRALEDPVYQEALFRELEES